MYVPVVAAAAAKVQADLGDLDAAMRDDGAHQRLLSLPLAGR